MYKSIKDWDETDLMLAVYALRQRGLIGAGQAARLMTVILDGTVPFPNSDAPLHHPTSCYACGAVHDSFVPCPRSVAGLMRPDPED